MPVRQEVHLAALLAIGTALLLLGSTQGRMQAKRTLLQEPCNKGFAPQSYNYLVDLFEGGRAGDNCTTDCQCDGNRTCVPETLECSAGLARPEANPNNRRVGAPNWCISKDYVYDESTSIYGASNCSRGGPYIFDNSDCFCDGARYCDLPSPVDQFPSDTEVGICKGAEARPAGWCDRIDYLYDEFLSPYGEELCASNNMTLRNNSDCYCDGQRKCVGLEDGTARCSGEARPDGYCTDGDYLYKESDSPFGANRCSLPNQYPVINSDCYCAAQRECKAVLDANGQLQPSEPGRCQGYGSACQKATYKYDESKSPFGSHRCPAPLSAADPEFAGRDCFCDGARRCSLSGYCN